MARGGDGAPLECGRPPLSRRWACYCDHRSKRDWGLRMISVLVDKTAPRLAPARTETLTEQAYNRLEEMIVTLSLAPGAVLSEQTLSAGLGIGRTPIREALQRLGHEGLVRVLPRKAIIVTDTDPKRQLLVLEVRRELERLLARAICRANPVRAMAASDKLIDYVEAFTRTTVTRRR
jgi:DNA-binding GntR family transcriptional regulator